MSKRWTQDEIINHLIKFAVENNRTPKYTKKPKTYKESTNKNYTQVFIIFEAHAH